MFSALVPGITARSYRENYEVEPKASHSRAASVSSFALTCENFTP